MPGEDAFATPQAKKLCKDGAGANTTPGRSLTAFEIPASPCLKRLGFGTGMAIFFSYVNFLLNVFCIPLY